MSKKYKEFIHSENDDSKHEWEKENLITLMDKNGGYDILYCKKCGSKGTVRTRTIIEFETNSLKQIQAFLNCSKYVETISLDDEPYDAGNTIILGRLNFSNVTEMQILTVGSEHKIVDPPKEYKKKYPNSETSVWVMGVTEKVRVLQGEFKFK